ncbi:dienelactone hydrolase family protein [Myxococcus sp. RHSTA-1-4]|uniref:dienelactone hydrolase family protein n=1 Tax=Myxococcus sp. RHSTA-1-4 TaxID=2874601 RepID=UPI001CBD20A0|nr:dienelactone hydrolase family protein [Myxococcus sp. RHSTA-1-4]MBZ4418686.1 dienelactone hydrolase family protein [Myxococcus sp. RHSTA-1-4]
MKKQGSRRSDESAGKAVRGLVDSGQGSAAWMPPASNGEVRVPVDEGVELQGLLQVPTAATGVVVLVRGHGSSRRGARDLKVARLLQAEGLGTLAVDLLTAAEEEAKRERDLRFNLGLFAGRLAGVARWLRRAPRTSGLKVGYLGSYTGAGAALAAAALRPESVDAVVCRGGRLALAATVLSRVRAPTLLIAGGEDTSTLEPHRRALGLLSAEKRLEVIPGATHHFEEPGAQARMVELAGLWFLQHLGASRWETEPAASQALGG